MARPRSHDKRKSIVEAATRVFAERGLGAATSAISAAAGVAEGTLFTYFATKDELVNALYCEIKLGLADAMMSGFPRKKTIRSRLKHVWNRYLDWGLENGLEHSVLKKAMVWEGLTAESRRAGWAPFVEIDRMVEEAARERVMQDLPRPFVEAAMSALAEMTIDLMRADPARADVYRKAGFEMFWGGVARG